MQNELEEAWVWFFQNVVATTKEVPETYKKLLWNGFAEAMLSNHSQMPEVQEDAKENDSNVEEKDSTVEEHDSTVEEHDSNIVAGCAIEDAHDIRSRLLPFIM